MRTITARAALAASCAMLLALTACSGGDDTDDGGSGGSTPAAEWTPGPLDIYESKVTGWSLDQDKAQAEVDRQIREVEELVATCMREEGFDYTPVIPESAGTQSGGDLEVKSGSREFAETYGYGISTEPWGLTETHPESDPNHTYVESMSESERAAYDEALWGPSEAQETDSAARGCYGSAERTLYGDGGNDDVAALDEFDALTKEIDRFRESVQTDPKIIELNRRWASCMADAGHDGMTDENSPLQALDAEWNTLRRWDDPDYVALTESWDWAADPNGPPAPETDAAAIKAFTVKEIAMAVTDVDCKSSLDYDASRQKVDHELQQSFVDQHKVELDAWVVAATTAREA